MNKVAYCWCDGRIGYGVEVPDEAMPIIAGEEKEIRERVSRAAVRGPHGEAMVPGVATARDPEGMAMAVVGFIDLLREKGDVG